MTAGRAENILLCNAVGAAVYSVLHLYLAWARGLPVSVNFALLVMLFIVAALSSRLPNYHTAFAIYSLALWFSVTVMTIDYANDSRCIGVPGVVLWLALGAALSGMSGKRQSIFYTQLSTVTFLWIVLAYNDIDYALVRWPLIVGAGLAGYAYREKEEIKGQFNKLEMALRIINAPQERRESP